MGSSGHSDLDPLLMPQSNRQGTTMHDPAEQQLVTELARAQVAQLAPKELPLFRPTCNAYFQDPEAALQGAFNDETLGFGAEAGLSFLTPIILAVTTQVVTFLLAEVKKSAQAEASAAIQDLVKRLFKGLRAPEQQADPTVPQLTRDQLQQVRSLAFEKARQLHLPEAKAALLADSLAGSLVVAG
jgi:hypothetical protein